MRDTIISGIGISRIGRKTDIAPLDLTVEAAAAAIADAGLSPHEIDAISTMGETPATEAAAKLGITPAWTGGAMGYYGLLTPVVDACEAVSRGRARHVLVYRTVNMLGGDVLQGRRAPRATASAPTEAPPGMADIGRILTMHGYSAANWLAMHLRRHMHLYGTTREQLGWLAVNSRRNAALNDRAAYRDPITLDDYLAARPISEPLGLLDCDVPVDGSIAAVISTASHTAGLDHPAVRVEAAGGASGHGGWDQRTDYPKMAASDAAAELWRGTDLRPADVDVVELYDGFSFLTLAWLEALGFCGDGESGPFVDGASRIALHGELPVNTYGGQLSAGRMHGYWVLHEACLQLRGEAGDRQVPGGPEVAAVSNGGGPIAGCLLLTR